MVLPVRDQRLVNNIRFQIPESHIPLVVVCDIDRNPSARTENAQIDIIFVCRLHGGGYFILTEIIGSHIFDKAIPE